jgi:hypothetical protein
MIGSSRQQHRELVSLISAIMIAKQPPDGMSQELEPNGKGRAPMEQKSSVFWPQIRNGLQIERDRFLQGCEDLLERPSLHRDVEIEADRLPLTHPAFGIAMERSGGQFRVPSCEPRFTLREMYRPSSLSSIRQAFGSNKTRTQVA